MQTLSFSPPKDKPNDTKDKAKALRSAIDDSVDALAKAVDDVRASETFQAYLNTQARFHKYSWHNSLLIMMQRPDASRVGGFQTWKKLGRFVRKGERGIMIFAPCPFHREEKSESGETESVDGIFFKAVHVFDVAQTDGKELPDVDCPIVDADASALLIALERIAGKRGIAVGYETMEGTQSGYATDKGARIALDDRHSTGQRAKTLAHELAHCALHFGKTNQATVLTRNIAELEAESIAYVVCRHFGLDTTVRSSAYIALWSGDAKALRASLERIAGTARAIIDDVDALDGAESEKSGGRVITVSIANRPGLTALFERSFDDVSEAARFAESWLPMDVRIRNESGEVELSAFLHRNRQHDESALRPFKDADGDEPLCPFCGAPESVILCEDECLHACEACDRAWYIDSDQNVLPADRCPVCESSDVAVDDCGSRTCGACGHKFFFDGLTYVDPATVESEVSE